MCSRSESRESVKDVYTNQTLRNFSSTFRSVNQKNFDKDTMLNHKASSQSMPALSFRDKSSILSQSSTNPPPIPPLPKTNHAKRPKSLKESKNIFTLAVRKSLESILRPDVGAHNKVHGEKKNLNVKKLSHLSMPIGRRTRGFSLSPEQNPPSYELHRKGESPTSTNSSDLSSTKNEKIANSSLSRGRNWSSTISIFKNNPCGNFRRQTEMEKFLDALEGKLPSSANRNFQDETKNRATNTTELPKIINFHGFQAYDEAPKINLAVSVKSDSILSSKIPSNDILSSSKFNEDSDTQKLEYAKSNELPVDKTRSKFMERDKEEESSHLGKNEEEYPFLSYSNRNRISNLNFFSESNIEQTRRHTVSTKTSSTLKPANFLGHSLSGDIDNIFGQKSCRVLNMPNTEKVGQSPDAIKAHIAVNPDNSNPNHTLPPVENTSRNSSLRYTGIPLATPPKDSIKAFVASSQPQIHHPVAIRPQIKHLSLDYIDKKTQVPPEKNADSLFKSKSILWPSKSDREEKQILEPGKDSCKALAEIMDCTSSVSLVNLITPYLESSNNLKSRLSDILNNTKLTGDVPSRNKLKTPDIQKTSHYGNPDTGYIKLMSPTSPKKTTQPPSVTRTEIEVPLLDFDPDAKHEKKTCKDSPEIIKTESVKTATILKTSLQINCESSEQVENYSARSPSYSEWPHIPGAWESSSKVYNMGSDAKYDAINWPTNFLSRISDGISIYTAFTYKRQEELPENKIAVESCATGSSLIIPNGNLDEVESESESIYCDAFEVISNPSELLSKPSRNIETHNLESSNPDPKSTCQFNTDVSSSEELAACRPDQLRLPNEKWEERDNLGIESRTKAKQTQLKERKKYFPASPDDSNLTRIVGEAETGRPGPFSGSRWDEYNFLHQRSLQKYQELLSPLSYDNSSTTDIHNDKLSENILTPDQKITPETNLPMTPQPQMSLDDSISGYRLDMLMERVKNLKSLMGDFSELDSAGIKNFSHPGRFKLSSSVTSAADNNQNLPAPGDSQYFRTTGLLNKFGELSSESRSPNSKRDSATMPSSRFSYSSDEKISSCPVLESRFSDSSDESYRPISRSSKHSDYKNGGLGEPAEFSENECPPLTTTTNIKTINLKSNQLFDNVNYTDLMRRKSDLISICGSQRCRMEQKDDFMSTIRRKKVNVSNKIRKHVSRPMSKLGRRRSESPYASRKINFSPNLGDSDLEKTDAWPFSISSPMKFQDSEQDILKECCDSSDGMGFKKYEEEIAFDNNNLLFSVVKKKKRLETLRTFFAVDE